MWQLLLKAFGGLFQTLRVLFLEVTGFFFLMIGGMILMSGYRQLRSYLNFGEVSHFKLISTLIFGSLMVGYGIHSFYRVRTLNRR